MIVVGQVDLSLLPSWIDLFVGARTSEVMTVFRVIIDRDVRRDAFPNEMCR